MLYNCACALSLAAREPECADLLTRSLTAGSVTPAEIAADDDVSRDPLAGAL